MSNETHGDRHGPRALLLVSGGLDGALAARLMVDAGWRLEGLHFSTGFNLPERTQAVAAGICGVPTDVVDVTVDYLDEVACGAAEAEPAGSCRRCRCFMLARAATEARRRGIEWLVSGDVIGQRAHGQARADLLSIDCAAGMVGRVLRPLSGRLLPPTAAEERGLVGRANLAGLHGRSRRAQFRLARELGITGLPTPSGQCCRLEQAAFLPRLRDFLAHRETAHQLASELKLLGLGRHFRTSWRAKVVFGRNEAESRAIAELAREDPSRMTCQVTDRRGSLGIVTGAPAPEDVRRIAALAARLSRSRDAARVEVGWGGDLAPSAARVVPASVAELEECRI